MKKHFTLEDLDCANCAAKIETAVAKLEDVTLVQVNFMRQKMTLEAPDEHFNDVLRAAKKTIKKIEPDVSIVE